MDNTSTLLLRSRMHQSQYCRPLPSTGRDRPAPESALGNICLHPGSRIDFNDRMCFLTTDETLHNIYCWLFTGCRRFPLFTPRTNLDQPPSNRRPYLYQYSDVQLLQCCIFHNLRCVPGFGPSCHHPKFANECRKETYVRLSPCFFL